jgi:hypothetical protein
MLSGIIAYQVLRQENPQTIEKAKAVLEKHPWYENQWHARLQLAERHANTHPKSKQGAGFTLGLLLFILTVR